MCIRDRPNPLNDEKDFIRYVDIMVGRLEKDGIPWAVVYGNHDNDVGKHDAVNTNVRKWRQQEIYESYAHCVATAGPEDIFGIGNYVLPILTNDESSIAFNVWCLDTGDYNENLDKSVYKFKDSEYIKNGYYTSVPGHENSTYDFIKYDQQLWYYNTSTIMENYNKAEIPAIMFGHICLPEFIDVYENRNDASVNFTGVNKDCLLYTSRGGLEGALYRRRHNPGGSRAGRVFQKSEKSEAQGFPFKGFINGVFSVRQTAIQGFIGSVLCRYDAIS